MLSSTGIEDVIKDYVAILVISNIDNFMVATVAAEDHPQKLRLSFPTVKNDTDFLSLFKRYINEDLSNIIIESDENEYAKKLDKKKKVKIVVQDDLTNKTLW
jgi:hypothetical protein